MANLRLIRRIVHWLLAATIVFYVVTGYGITQFRIVESITSGLLSKVLSFKFHGYLIIPLLILMIAHIVFALSGWGKSKQDK